MQLSHVAPPEAVPLEREWPPVGGRAVDHPPLLPPLGPDLLDAHCMPSQDAAGLGETTVVADDAAGLVPERGVGTQLPKEAEARMGDAPSRRGRWVERRGPQIADDFAPLAGLPRHLDKLARSKRIDDARLAAANGYLRVSLFGKQPRARGGSR